MSGTVLRVEDKVVSKTDKLFLSGAYILEGNGEQRQERHLKRCS